MYLDVDYIDRLADLQLQARIWWALSGASILLLTILLSRSGVMRGRRRRKSPASALRMLHRSESATASMEYLLVLFPFLIIVMTVWQLAFMINAQLHVGYAAYAAARSASVMIHADLQSEEEGLLKQDGQSGATKWARIRRAAVPGTIAVSPGNWQTAGGVALASSVRRGGLGNLGTLPDVTAIGARLTLMTVHHTKQSISAGTRFQRAIVKNVYAERMTEVLVNGRKHTEPQNLAGIDAISVTVNYVFWLHVPYVGRLLEAMFEGWKNPLTGEYVLINPFPSLQLSETITMTAWPRKRAIEPCSK
jgi:hypothetical protein